jgi:hypothetical protein
MKQSREYYYLIAGLPAIDLEGAKPGLSAPALREELRIHLHPDDFRTVELIFLPADNRNLLRLLGASGQPFDPAGNLSAAQLEDGLREPRLLPPYMGALVRAFREEIPVFSELSWENQLTWLFYDYALARTDGLLHAWFRRERDLRDLLAALTARRFDLPPDREIIGRDAFAAALRRSHARDFGLSREHPFVNEVLQIEEQDRLLERERRLDRLRWRFIEEENRFNYFTVEVIQGYLLRLGLAERWHRLDPAAGEQVFLRLVEDLVPDCF